MMRKINDIVIYVLFCFLFGTGIMLKYTFVKGAGMQLVLGMGKHGWETLHLYAGFLAAVSVLVHVLLNAKFVKNAICKKSAFATAMFVLAGAALIFGLGFFPKKTLPKNSATTVQTNGAAK